MPPSTNKAPSWMNVISTVYPEFSDAAQHLRSMDLKQRSLVIKLCQAQYAPGPDSPSSPLKMMVESSSHYRHPYMHFTTRSLLSFALDFRSLISQPVSSAILLDICRSAPLPPLEIRHAQIESWNKEIVCCETTSAVPVINWEPIFNHSHSHNSILPGVPPNPTMAHYAAYSISRWLKKMKGRRLYPRMTHKNMSWATRRDFEETFNRSLEDVPIFGQDDWQRVYLKTGIRLRGECEMRQKWYPSSAKPRTYYAQGGEAYGKSQNLQDSFTDLVNIHPPTNHITRLRPTRLLIRNPDQTVRVYDLTSFTSKMHEQRRFCRRLAQEAYGITVEVVDVRVGLIQKDLGDLLEDYNDFCVEFPEVSYERCFKGEYGYHLTDHGTASMLGIFGNLMTCTMAHGLVMLQVVEHEDEVNVAGDDGAVVEGKENEEAIDICICALGSYERSKTFRSSDKGCICLKRPLWQELGVLHQGTNCVPPNIALIQHLAFGIDDPRYNFTLDKEDSLQAIRVLAKDLMRFLRSVHRASWKLDDNQLYMAITVYDGLSRQLKQPYTGGVPQCGDPTFWPVRPTLESLREEDPLVTLVRTRYRSPVEVPLRESVESVDVRDLELGDVFESNGNRLLGLYSRLGLIKSEKVLVLREGIEGYEWLLRQFTDFKTPYVNRYEVISSIPPHLIF